jgi:hypothetical protein
MDDFRKKMHVAYKKKIAQIICDFLDDLNDATKQENLPLNYAYIIEWVNTNCLPMGDFDKEKAMKEIQEWNS